MREARKETENDMKTQEDKVSAKHKPHLIKVSGIVK